MSHLPPDYSNHDALYRKFRERGANGWNDEQADSYLEMLQFILPELPPIANDNSVETLEIGCGAGNFSMLLAQQGFTVTGIDISPTAIEWANERANAISKDVSFRVDNVLNLGTCDDGILIWWWMVTACIASSEKTAPVASLRYGEC